MRLERRQVGSIVLKRGILWVICLLLIWCGSCAGAETVLPEAMDITPSKAPEAGDTVIGLRWPWDTETIQVNVFSGGTSIMDSATLEDGTLTLRLLRALEDGEVLQVVTAADDGAEQTLTLTVLPGVNKALAALETRLAEMGAVWQDNFLPVLLKGAFYIPCVWTDLPFTLYPDEAPALSVEEADNQVRITLEGRLPATWRVCLAQGIPVEKWDCTWSDAAQCWIGEGPFEAVCLIREDNGDGFMLDLSYLKDTGYMAEYPVLEYARKDETSEVVFNCYGWGTVRNYLGSMYAVGLNDMFWYAEYGLEHQLVSYFDLTNGLTYDAKDQLIEGTEPEGYVHPVIHTLK